MPACGILYACPREFKAIRPRYASRPELARYPPGLALSEESASPPLRFTWVVPQKGIEPSRTSLRTKPPAIGVLRHEPGLATQPLHQKMYTIRATIARIPTIVHTTPSPRIAPPPKWGVSRNSHSVGIDSQSMCSTTLHSDTAPGRGVEPLPCHP